MYILNHFYKEPINKLLANKVFKLLGEDLQGISFKVLTKSFITQGITIDVCKNPSDLKEFVETTKNDGSELLLFGIRRDESHGEHATLINPKVNKNLFYDGYENDKEYTVVDCHRIKLQKQELFLALEDMFKFEGVEYAYDKFRKVSKRNVLKPVSISYLNRFFSVVRLFIFIFKLIFSLIKSKF
jgi:hypothetical protein